MRLRARIAGSRVLFAAALVLLAAPAAWAEHTRVTNPNALSVEVLGRGILYSVDYDRVMNDDMAAGIGIGKVNLNLPDGTDSGLHTTVVPAYVNYYFTRDQGSIYATGGVTVVSDSSTANGLVSSPGNVKFNSNAVLPNFGLGYENRGDSGFLVRLTALAIVAKSVAPWGGLTFGYAF
jgi:hypothetical protein